MHEQKKKLQSESPYVLLPVFQRALSTEIFIPIHIRLIYDRFQKSIETHIRNICMCVYV